MSMQSYRLVVTIVLVGTCGSATAVTAQKPPARRSVVRIVAHALGGAVVGTWAGYLASQIAWSDWRQDPGRGAQRVRFSVAGGAAGLVAGALIGSRRSRPAVDLDTESHVQSFPFAGPITADEIRASSARSLTELLRRLRPQWLRTRGRDVLRVGGNPPAASGVQVYLDGELLGGLSTLDQVSIDLVTGVQFIDPGPAVLRWGAGNEDGAILLTTQETP